MLNAEGRASGGVCMASLVESEGKCKNKGGSLTRSHKVTCF